MDIGWHLRNRVWRPIHEPIDQHRARRRAHRFHRSFVSAGDLVFDVGANVSNWTRLLLDIGARVVAVEPQPSNFHQRGAIHEQVALGREQE